MFSQLVSSLLSFVPTIAANANQDEKSEIVEMATMQQIKNGVKSSPVFMVSKSYCPNCNRAKEILNNYSIDKSTYKVVEIDNDPEMEQIQDYMEQLTGARTVPRVFIGSKCVGGGESVAKLHQQNKLKALLKTAGAINQ